MDQVRHPIRVAEAAGHVGRRKRQPREADVVVAQIPALGVVVGRAVAIIELVAEHHIDHEPIREHEATEAALGNAREPRQDADDLDLVAPVQHLAIARHQDAHIAAMAQAARQGGRDIAEPAHLHEIGDFGRDEEHAPRGFNARLARGDHHGGVKGRRDRLADDRIRLRCWKIRSCVGF